MTGMCGIVNHTCVSVTGHHCLPLPIARLVDRHFPVGYVKIAHLAVVVANLFVNGVVAEQLVSNYGDIQTHKSKSVKIVTEWQQKKMIL